MFRLTSVCQVRSNADFRYYKEVFSPPQAELPDYSPVVFSDVVAVWRRLEFGKSPVIESPVMSSRGGGRVYITYLQALKLLANPPLWRCSRCSFDSFLRQ